MAGTGFRAARFYSRPGRVLAVCIAVIAVLVVVGTLLNLGARGLFALPIGFVVIVASYLLFWRPVLRVQSDGVIVVNPFRTYVLSYDQIRAVSIQWNLHIETGGRSLAVWAVPRSSNASQLGSARRDAYGRVDYDAQRNFQTTKALGNAEAAARVIMSHIQPDDSRTV